VVSFTAANFEVLDADFEQKSTPECASEEDFSASVILLLRRFFPAEGYVTSLKV